MLSGKGSRGLLGNDGDLWRFALLPEAPEAGLPGGGGGSLPAWACVFGNTGTRARRVPHFEQKLSVEVNSKPQRRQGETPLAVPISKCS